jgi:organic radical activating enzyme
MYAVKEIFFTLQGEGRHTGRPAVFCRFSGCNLWTGREASRATAVCQFCDTDFVGTDGPGGGTFRSAADLVSPDGRRPGVDRGVRSALAATREAARPS